MKRTPIKRKTPLKASRKPIPKVNHKRAKRLRLKQFGTKEEQQQIKDMPCCVCGFEHPEMPSIPHHVKTRGASGTKDNVVPLCAECHEKVHRMGRHTFNKVFNVNLEEIALRLHSEGEE